MTQCLKYTQLQFYVVVMQVYAVVITVAVVVA